MTEAVVSIPFFVLVLSLTLFAGGVVKTKLYALRTTRQAAWSHAVANCGDPGDQPSFHEVPRQPTRARSGASLGSPDLDLGEGTSIGGGAPGAASVSEAVGTAQATFEKTVGRAVGGMAPTRVTSRTEVACNEVPRDGNLRGFLQAAWGYVAP